MQFIHQLEAIERHLKACRLPLHSCLMCDRVHTALCEKLASSWASDRVARALLRSLADTQPKLCIVPSPVANDDDETIK